MRVSALGGVVGGGSACALPCGRPAVCPAWAVRAVGGLGVGQRAGLFGCLRAALALAGRALGCGCVLKAWLWCDMWG